MKIARRTCRGDECTDIEGMMKIVGGMKVAASRLARGMVSSANPGIYSKTYPEGSFDSGGFKGAEILTANSTCQIERK